MSTISESTQTEKFFDSTDDKSAKTRKKNIARDEWRKRYPLLHLIDAREYRFKKKESLREYYAAYRARKKDELKQYHAEWRAKNKSRVVKCAAKSRKKMQENGKYLEYCRRRSETDPLYKLTRNYRCRIKIALKLQSTSKTTKTAELIGTSGKEFLEYLLQHPNNDGSFTSANMGSAWVIDHIRPIASFDITDDSQLRQAFHYTNCQPLTPEDNAKKGSWWMGCQWSAGKPVQA